MGLGDLLLVALVPILKVLIITGAGLFLALERIDLLGPIARHHLNNVSLQVTSNEIQDSRLLKFQSLPVSNHNATVKRVQCLFCFFRQDTVRSHVCYWQIVYYVFSPALVVCYLAETITLQSLLQL